MLVLVSCVLFTHCFLRCYHNPSRFCQHRDFSRCAAGERHLTGARSCSCLFMEGFSTVYLEMFPVKQFWLLALDQRHLARWSVGWMWCLLWLHPSCRTGHGREVHPRGHWSMQCSELSLEPSAVCSCWAAAGRAAALGAVLLQQLLQDDCRILGPWNGLCWKGPKAQSLGQVAQGTIQPDFEQFQGCGSHNLSG